MTSNAIYIINKYISLTSIPKEGNIKIQSQIFEIKEFQWIAGKYYVRTISGTWKNSPKINKF